MLEFHLLPNVSFKCTYHVGAWVDILDHLPPPHETVHSLHGVQGVHDGHYGENIIDEIFSTAMTMTMTITTVT